MAEAYFREFHGEAINVYSAGIETHGLNPFAMGVLLEDGLDISEHSSNTIEDLPNVQFDIVLTVCDHANEVCPIFPGVKKQIHHNFTDPSKASGTAAEILAEFRKTRYEIKMFVKGFVV
jgi:arsenate reductase